MIVVDASAIIELLLNTRQATRVAERLFVAGPVRIEPDVGPFTRE